MPSHRDRYVRPVRVLHAAAGGAFLLLGAACGDGTGPVIQPPPVVYDLVVEARVRGFTEPYRVPLDGGAPVKLLPGWVYARHPVPSPDGRRLVYWDVTDHELWVVDLLTGARWNVSRFDDEMDVSPTWSPDGTRLAFASFRSGPSDIYVVNADGSGLRNIMPSDFPAGTFEAEPAWSPDGTRIAFSSDRDGRRSIYTIRPDGSGLRRITNTPTARDHEPAWSPDGTRIVFRRDFSVDDGLDTDLAIAYVDDSDLVVFHKAGRERDPSWSPDGELIAYSSDAVGNDYRVFTMRVNGSDVAERAGGLAYGRHASFPRWMRRH